MIQRTGEVLNFVDIAIFQVSIFWTDVQVFAEYESAPEFPGELLKMIFSRRVTAGTNAFVEYVSCEIAKQVRCIEHEGLS